MSFPVTAGVFLISLASLTLELLLTRFWSVISYYHFAFVAVSLAMLGMTAGALLIYLYPERFQIEHTKRDMAASALLFSIAVVFSVMTQLCVPFVPRKSILGLYLALLDFGAASLPFCFSGVCVALAFSRFSANIGSLYAADLIGAAFGCLFLVGALTVSDGPSVAFMVAAVGAAAAYSFAGESASAKLKKWSGVCLISFAAFAYINTVLTHHQKPLLTFMWSKGELLDVPLYEKWNPFSRLTVVGDPDKPTKPECWGLSKTYDSDHKISQLWFQLDSVGQTVLTKFAGNYSEVEHLKFDVCSFCYRLQEHPSVAILGVGGGRDLLSALAFGARSVVAIDINPNIISTLNGRFGDFTGHLDRDPRVKFVAEDARTFITKTASSFDVIQFSIIDTVVASSTGALSLTENSLYTVEAWCQYLNHLTPGGMISCTRWYNEKKPGEIERLVATARAALSKAGQPNPRLCIVVVRAFALDDDKESAATVIVKRTPFTPAQIALIHEQADKLQFVVSLDPQHAESSSLDKVLSGNFFIDGVNLKPVTDDSPFFFYMLKPLDALLKTAQPETSRAYLGAESILIELLLVVSCFSAICMLLPATKPRGRLELKSAWTLLLYFSAIGFGFILLEISQMQRLILFLGNPTYSLSVVLFSLLLSAGAGSYLTRNVADDKVVRVCIGYLAAIVIWLFVYWFSTPALLHYFQTADVLVRLFVAGGTLVPLGLLLGTAFPLGLQVAIRQFRDMVPWFWAVNGAASICATVLATVIAIGAGLSTAYLAGGCCYVIALAALFFHISSRSYGVGHAA